MSTNRAINQLRSLWAKAGGGEAPVETDDGEAHQGKAAAVQPHKKSLRTSRLDLRITREEKQRVELIALRENVPINEVFARMLALYEREHGRVQLTSPQIDPEN